MGSHKKKSKPSIEPRPWLCVRGFILPDDQLILISKSWSPEIWESYLKWIETPRSESLFDPKLYTELAGALQSASPNYILEISDPEMVSAVQFALSALSEIQRKIINLIFWEGRSVRNISKQLEIPRSSVYDEKQRALKIISTILSKNTGRLPYVEEQANFNEGEKNENVN